MDKYTYKITYLEKDNEYVGLCVEFPSLSWIDTTQEKALSGILNTVRTIVQDMKHNNEQVPEPLSVKKYSGKFTVRILPDVHRKLEMQAKEVHVSLNRLVSSKLS